MRRATMRIEVVARLPALDHDVGVGIMDRRVAFIGDATLFLQRLGDAFLVPGDERIALVRLQLRGGDDVSHCSLPCSSWLSFVLSMMSSENRFPLCANAALPVGIMI